MFDPPFEKMVWLENLPDYDSCTHKETVSQRQAALRETISTSVVWKDGTKEVSKETPALDWATLCAGIQVRVKIPRESPALAHPSLHEEPDLDMICRPNKKGILVLTKITPITTAGLTFLERYIN